MKRSILKLTALFLTLAFLLCACGGDPLIPFSGAGYSSSDAPSSSGPEPSSSGTETPVEGDYTPGMWRVTSDTYPGTLYLFGSIHVGDDEMFPLPDYVENAYASCGALAVECDIVAFEQLPENEIMKYYYPFVLTDGTTVRDHLPKETYEAAKKILTKAGYYNASLDYYNAVMWNDLVDQAAVEHSGLSYENGIDRHFLTDAHLTGKKILEVESVEFQYNMELGFSDELIALLMRDCAEDSYLDDYKDGVLEMLASWKDGSIYDNFEYDYSELTDEERELMEAYDKVMETDRNIGMADAAESYMKQGMNVFFVVGAAHMGGDGGVVALLESRGYNVQPVR